MISLEKSKHLKLKKAGVEGVRRLTDDVNESSLTQKIIQKRLTGDCVYLHINYLVKNYINSISDVLK